MNTFTFKNSSVDVVDSTSTTISKVININTKISTLNINTPIFVLSGIFNTQINIINNCSLNLDANFIFDESIINLVNNDSIKKEVFIVGNIENLKSDFKINSDNNVELTLNLATKNISNNTININITASKNDYDLFRINSIENNSFNNPKINFKVNNTKNIIINSDIENFDIGEATNVNLLVSEKSDIKNFQNIKNETFASVISSERVAHFIEESFNIKIPITALFFKFHIENGRGFIFISNERNVLNEPHANIILNSKLYNIQ